ncbi:MAG: PAS domain S-box protein [Desulfobaccales bacterium]
MLHFFTTLRFRLILLVFLAVLPALGLILLSGMENRRLAVSEAKKDVQDLVLHASTYQERVVEGVRQLLLSLSEVSCVRQRDGAGCMALFARILERQKIYANISAYDPQGNLFASALPQPPASAVGRSHFDRALATRDFAIGEFGIGRASGKPTLHFGYPVIDHGVVQGVVSASVDLSYLNTLVAKTDMPPGARLTVIDRDGTILARHPQPEHWVGKRMPEAEIVKIVLSKKERVAEAAGIDGVLCLFAFTPLGERDLFVYAGVPLQTIYAEARRILGRNLLALGGAAVLAMVLAWVLGQFFLINRTRALVNTSQQLAGGDLTVRSGISYDDGEFGQMAGAFDKMAEAMQQRDQSIRESEAKYRALIETTGTGYVIIDPQGKVLDANPEYLRLTGYDTLGEILGRSVVEWTAAPDLQRNAAAVQECAAKGSIRNLEVAYVQKNGETVPIEINATFIQDASSKKILSLVRDITDRKLAERSLAQQFNFLQLLIDTIPSPIFYKDVNGVYQGCNRSLAEFLGRPKEAIIGKTVF